MPLPVETDRMSSVGRSGRADTRRPVQRILPWGMDMQASRGFTLIEVLVVIVVIALLASLVAPNVFRHLGTAKDATARSQIQMLGAALDAYRLDNGRYPSTEQGLEALSRAPALEPRPRNWRGPYLRGVVPVDPWGNTYVYRSPGTDSEFGFDLLSRGADGQEGGEGDDADIRLWEDS